MLELDGYLVGTVLILCRIGTMMMIAPGFSSVRVPARFRLYIALALTLFVSPAVLGDREVRPGSGGTLTRMIFAECAVGAVIGIVCRFYISALEFMCNAIANYIGLSAIATGIDHDEPVSPITTLITLVATLLVLLLDLHHLMIRTVFDTYATVPIGATVDPQFGIRTISAALGSAFAISLQISGPFILYGILLNLMFGVLGKIIPQVPSYFVSIPFLLIGGLVLLYYMIPDIMRIFIGAFSAALTNL